MSNVAVVGLGGMGLRHCEAISQLETMNVNLVSVCDIDIKRVKETSNTVSYTHLTLPTTVSV